jgi:hypothetical protein
LKTRRFDAAIGIGCCRHPLPELWQRIKNKEKKLEKENPNKENPNDEDA